MSLLAVFLQPPSPSETIWPWPLVPLSLLLLLLLVIPVLGLLDIYVIGGVSGVAGDVPTAAGQRRALPILAGFGREILPALVVFWTVIIAAYLIEGGDFWWPILVWGTVTLLMLWPVGWHLGRSYLSYRRPLFVLGVLSMAYLPFTGFAMRSDWSYSVKLTIFLALPVVLTIFGILPSLKPAIGRPLGMFFRPDLLFGDGRVLVGGTIAFVLGLRYLVGMPPPAGVSIPIPRWDWYATFYVIVLGFVPLIAARGILKLLLRLRRIRDDRWTGWWPSLLRDLLLVVSLLNIGYGFHHIFMGVPPFDDPMTVFHEYTWVPALTLTLAAAFLVGVRGAYKRRIGEPFIKETTGQTLVKSILYVIGVFVLFWSLMSILTTSAADIARAGYRPLAGAELSVAEHSQAVAPGGAAAGAAPAGGTGERHGPRTWPDDGFLLPGIKGIVIGRWNWIGLALLVWGLIVLIPFRVLAQVYQRQAIVSQMAAVILPTFTPPQRRRVLERMIRALLAMEPAARQTYLRAMHEGLASAPEADRAVTTRTMVEILTDLPAAARDALIESQAAALARLKRADRVTRMADMMGAVSALPEEQRRVILQRMAMLMH